jgi:hypothetical protein
MGIVDDFGAHFLPMLLFFITDEMAIGMEPPISESNLPITRADISAIVVDTEMAHPAAADGDAALGIDGVNGEESESGAEGENDSSRSHKSIFLCHKVLLNSVGYSKLS